MIAHPLFLGFVVMSVASLAVFAHGSKRPAIRDHSYMHSAVAFIAATAYLAMTLDIGTVVNADGVPTFTPRYADWALTTPLLLVGLAMTAIRGRRDATGFVVALVTLDVVMILAGLASSLTASPPLRLLWFAWSSAAFLGVLYVLWVPLRRFSRSGDGAFDRAYRAKLVFLTVVWCFYPLVFAAGPEGLRLIATETSVWAILVLDVVAKVVYAVFAGASLDKALPAAADTPGG